LVCEVPATYTDSPGVLPSSNSKVVSNQWVSNQIRRLGSSVSDY
jgi:hypothetical protein